jgi:hypothetical protein
MVVYDTYIYNYQIYSNIPPPRHSGSTADGDIEEEAEGRSRRTNIPLQLERRCGADAATGEKTGESLMRMIALCADVEVAELEGE